LTNELEVRWSVERLAILDRLELSRDGGRTDVHGLSVVGDNLVGGRCTRRALNIDVHACSVDLVLALRLAWSSDGGRPVPDPVKGIWLA